MTSSNQLLHPMTRRVLMSLVGIAATGARVSAQTPQATPTVASSPITTCGVNYDVCAEIEKGLLTRPVAQEQYFNAELQAIHDDLHCESVGLYGSLPDMLLSGLEKAVDVGLDVRLQCRFNHLPLETMQEMLTEVAIGAEQLRAEGAAIVLDVGCEYLMFADGLIPGDDFYARMEAISEPYFDWVEPITKLHQMVGMLAQTARTHFNGLITYSDTPGIPTLWENYDIVGIDHYLSAESRPTYIDQIAELANLGKPVWINEFGSCPYTGAGELGGMAWDIHDWDVDPPVIVDGIERNEQDQWDAIAETLDLIEQSPAERAYIYQFLDAGSPRNQQPEYDYDLASYSIVSIWGEDHASPYDETGFYEPKIAFEQLAARNASRQAQSR